MEYYTYEDEIKEIEDRGMKSTNVEGIQSFINELNKLSTKFDDSKEADNDELYELYRAALSNLLRHRVEVREAN